MEFAILGPLEVRRDRQAVAVGGPKPRIVLALLLVHANQPVSAEKLALALWGEEAPAGATRTVHVHVSRLRKALGDENALVTTGAGYRLRVRADELDATRFERLLEEARAGTPTRAYQLLSDALALWRGEPLADVAYAAFAQPEIRRLNELRLAAIEARADAALELGIHGEVVAALTAPAERYPAREELARRLMVALYRTGRHAESLEVFHRTRAHLRDELGLEPSPELRELQQAILTHDAALGRIGDEREQGRSRTPAASRLPYVPNRTLGRAQEIDSLADLLVQEHTQLVTLTGPGGVGKTRLALESARVVERQFANGADFISLAATERSDDVPMTVAAGLGLAPLARESHAEAVKRHVTARDLLLVLDNLEHVLDAATFVAALLAAAPRLTVLATSREPLNVASERRFLVAPLALPGSGSDENAGVLADVPAVALFSERARARAPDFELTDGNAPAVGALCRRLDGLPLAIELAAARCDLFSPAEILARLDVSLAGGARDAPARHQSLRAALDSSYELLTEREQFGFARFAVFTGGATVDAAERITRVTPETLSGLVNKSLLVRSANPRAGTRLGMLELVRAYAAERLATAPDSEGVHRRHFEFFVDLLRRHGTEQALFGADSGRHMAILDADEDNLHSALRWTITRRAGDDAMRMLAALARYWRSRARDADIVGCSQAALALASAETTPETRIAVLLAVARSLRWLGREGEQPPLLAEAEALARRLGDPLMLAHTLRMRADQGAMSGDLHVCERYADEALQSAEAAGSRWEYASAAHNKAIAATTLAELDKRVHWAAALLDESGNLSRLARLWYTAANVALRLGDADTALRFAERALPITHALADSYDWATAQLMLGYAATLAGDSDRAEPAFRHYFTRRRALDMPPEADAFMALAALAASCGQDRHAARLAGLAQTHKLFLDEVLADSVHVRFLSHARRRLGAEAWHASARDGARLTVDDGIDEALAFLDHAGHP